MVTEPVSAQPMAQSGLELLVNPGSTATHRNVMEDFQHVLFR
jgi:hypothetical protein